MIKLCILLPMSIQVTCAKESHQSFDHVITSLAVAYFFGPIIGVIAMLASEILSSMSGRYSKGDNLPISGHSITEIKKPWVEKGWEFARAQIVVGLVFKLTHSGINQAAIHWIRQNLRTPMQTLLCYFRVAVVAPFTEELVFRGFLQDRIHDIQTLTFGAKAAISKIHTTVRIILQAIVFGLCHYHPMQGMANLLIVVMTGVMGMVVGGIKEETGRVTESIGMHSLLNASVTTRVWLFGA